jgi:hypothetical protein
MTECVICYDEWTKEDREQWNGAKIFICEECNHFTCGWCMDKMEDVEMKEKGLDYRGYTCNKNIQCSYCRTKNYKYHFDENVLYWIKYADHNFGSAVNWSRVSMWCIWCWIKLGVIDEADKKYLMKEDLEYIANKNKV